MIALVAIARLSNANRHLQAQLYRAGTLQLKDAAMFAKLLKLAAEFETEADGFVKDHFGIVTVVEQRFETALGKIKSARADAQKAIADAGTVLTDAGKVKSDAGQALAPVAQAVTTAVTAATTAGTTVLPVAQAAIGNIASAAAAAVSGLTVSGPGIASGATVTAIDTGASTITLDTPTNADHAGDGSETLTITPAAANA